jgi:hypothetical protein
MERVSSERGTCGEGSGLVESPANGRASYGLRPQATCLPVRIAGHWLRRLYTQTRRNVTGSAETMTSGRHAPGGSWPGSRRGTRSDGAPARAIAPRRYRCGRAPGSGSASPASPVEYQPTANGTRNRSASTNDSTNSSTAPNRTSADRPSPAVDDSPGHLRLPDLGMCGRIRFVGCRGPIWTEAIWGGCAFPLASVSRSGRSMIPAAVAAG